MWMQTLKDVEATKLERFFKGILKETILNKRPTLRLVSKISPIDNPAHNNHDWKR